ncbi:hypothetical protein ACLOJK_020148 [Asimina triloba]
MNDCSWVFINNIFISSPGSSPNTDGINIGTSYGVAIWDSTIATDIHVYDCTFTGTSNAARIKTWQGGSGFARGISFQGINVDNVQNPIVIDQYYCDGGICGPQLPSAVAVSDVQFRGFRGTSSGQSAIQLSCSRTVGCTKIVVGDVQLAPANPRISLYSSCINAHGFNCPSCTPPVTCLT